MVFVPEIDKKIAVQTAQSRKTFGLRNMSGIKSGLAALAMSVSILASGHAFAEGLQAAVIGNTNYPAAPLANASRDAAIVAEALAQVGYEVSTYFDVTSDQIEGVLAEISEQFEGAEISIIYYAGHAFQFDGQNQLLAVDIDELSRDEIENKVFSMRDVLDATRGGESAGGNLRLVIIDGCRNDPFSAIDEGIERGVAFEEAGDAQTLIAYSTSAGELAFDGPAGGNGPYALALTRALLSEETTLSKGLRSVRRDVRIATSGVQIPWVVGSIEDDPVIGVQTKFEELVPASGDETPSLDEIVWSFVSADLTTITLNAFVQNFPNSRFAPDASQRMREIQSNREETTRQLTLVEGGVSGNTLNELAEAREQVDADTRFRASSNIPAELFALWPEELPDTLRGLKSVVTNCDLLAAGPADPRRIAPPVGGRLVNIREAARACGFALASDPENPRLLFQFGRVLQLAGRHDWARKYYLRSSAYGYSAALTNLGFMAIEGIGQDIDYDAAAEFYIQAAAQGNLRARTNVGSLYIKGHGVPKNPEEGVLWFRLAAGMGWPNAQNALADHYRRGIGVPEDLNASASLYHLAASNGQRDAMNNLGRSYLAGWGVEQNQDTARLWFERAIAAGDRFAPRNLALNLVESGDGQADPERVLSLLKLSTNRGLARAYLDLSRLYLNEKIVAQDAEQAFLNARIGQERKLEKAAELVERSMKLLTPEQIERVEEEIRQRRRLNGI